MLDKNFKFFNEYRKKSFLKINNNNNDPNSTTVNLKNDKNNN